MMAESLPQTEFDELLEEESNQEDENGEEQQLELYVVRTFGTKRSVY